MYQYLAKYNLLYDAQSGFRSNHSCQTALSQHNRKMDRENE